MIEHTYKEIYNQDSMDKQFTITYEGGEITNEDLYSESFELTESLCSQSELRFGSCEASVIKFKIANTVDSLVNKWLTVSQILDAQTDTPFQFGKYKVVSDVPSGDRNYRNVTAYDSMYDIINADVSAWYESLTFPLTLKEFRDSFFSHFDITQVDIELIHDDMSIEKTIATTNISGKVIITAICELNGVFGHINRQGQFAYISLPDKVGLYPSVELYPSNSLLPINPLSPVNGSYDATTEVLTNSKYISCEYEDFETSFISKLQIRQEQNDIGVIVGEGNNTYIIEDNFLVYGKEPAELEEIANKTFEKIRLIQYRPMSVALRGNPCMEVGDAILVHTRNKEVASYILQRTIKGIQSLRDTFSAEGVYEYAEKVNSVQKEVKRLKGKTNVLERTVEQTRSEIKDTEENLQSQITQNADSISAEVKRAIDSEVEMAAAIKINADGIKQKVSKGEVVSEINQSAEEVKIKGEKISLEGTVTANENFKVLEDGSIQSKNGTFEGTIKSKNAEITGGIVNIQTNSSTSNAISLYWNNYKNELAPYHIMFSDPSNESYFSSNSMWMGYLEELFLYVAKGGVNIYTNLSVGGTKSRLAKTKSYNDRLLYCYEMPSPIFGDVGHGVIGEDGLCYVDIDQVFFETVDMNQSYQVFLQSYAESNVYVIEKQPQYFVVKGEPNTEFDWELKAKQLDFPIERLEEKLPEDDYKETDYVTSANEYLSQFEQEVLNHG